MLIKTVFTILIVLIVSCAHTEVREKDKVDSAAFDGNWQGQTTGTKGSQTGSRNTRFTCGKRVFRVILRVSNGVINGYVVGIKKASFKTFLNDTGKFYHAVPKEGVSYTPIGLSDGKIKGVAKEFHVFKGALDSAANEGQGTYTLASTQFGMTGCDTDIKFTRK